MGKGMTTWPKTIGSDLVVRPKAIEKNIYDTSRVF